MNQLFIALQKLVPQHTLSRIAGVLARTRVGWIKSLFIKQFILRYGVDLSEAQVDNPDDFATFNDFFCRELKTGLRPVAAESNAVTSPADGVVSEIGDIASDRILQAKNHDYSVAELVGGDAALASVFQNGKFATIYLSPKDYHRVHMPLDGKLNTMLHVPGDLFSVNNVTTDHLPGLFARNERVICIFDSNIGQFAVVLIGAMIVGSIDTVWDGQITPIKKEIRRFDYTQSRSIKLKKGEEMGRFKLGSTVVLLFPPGKINWTDLTTTGSKVIMGQLIGSINRFPS